VQEPFWKTPFGVVDLDALGLVIDAFHNQVPETWEVHNCFCVIDARKLETWNWEIPAARILVGFFQPERKVNVYIAATQGVTVRVVIPSCGLEMEKEETEST